MTANKNDVIDLIDRVINLAISRFAVDLPSETLAALAIATAKHIVVSAMLDGKKIDQCIDLFHAQLIEITGRIAATVKEQEPALATAISDHLKTCPCPNCTRAREGL